MTLTVRPMAVDDVPGCLRIVNHIIAVGGTTAYEAPFTEAEFEAHYLHEPPISHVALLGRAVVGFQAVFDVGDGLYSIGSFTDRQQPVRGAGRALFDATLAACRARGGVAILAKITADNVPGLAYYTRMGFADWQVWPGDAARNGKPVDRVVKRYPLD
ncbi:MAG: GNAT family N-acetyltransferase [Pseudomonadota bacterium]